MQILIMHAIGRFHSIGTTSDFGTKFALKKIWMPKILKNKQYIWNKDIAMHVCNKFESSWDFLSKEYYNMAGFR